MGRRLLGAAAMGAVLLGAAGWWVAGPGADPEPTAAALAAEGAGVYAANCAACHGADGQGEANWRTRKPNGRLPAPPLNGDGHTWHHPDRQLTEIIVRGIEALAPAGYESDMPAFGDRLSDREVRAVLAHVKTWWPDQKRRHQAALE
jgi:mono/diheme cytochrome c family protein